jgi:predicted HD phosphohydrolase
METALDVVVEEVLDLYRTCRTAFPGDRVSLSQHMAQTAQCAVAAGASNELVVAAFFHDIGQLCVTQHYLNGPCGFGRKSFEKIGADFLRERGFNERLARLVEGHVEANRYLSFSCCEYYGSLNEANKRLLECQGGPMSRGEARAFERDPLFPHYVLLRRWDALAPTMGPTVIDWEALARRIERTLQSL